MQTDTQYSTLLTGVQRLVFIGDSLTDGSWYPDYVVNTLNRLHPEADFELINAGVCGDTAADLLTRLQADVIKRGPELVFVGIGTNDCSMRRPIDQFEQDLERIIQEIRDCGSKVLLLRPSPRTDAKYAASFPPYLRAVDAVAAREGVPLADVHGEFERYAKAGRKVLWSDGVHHDLAGFEAMARAVLDALGYPGVDLDMELRPASDLLLAWENSAPIAWKPGEPLPAPEAAGNWTPYNRASTLRGPDAGFAKRGAWLPFAQGVPEKPVLAFGRTHFDAELAGPMELQVGGSHPLVVWLNGREVWRSLQAHGYHANADRLEIQAAQGRNELVALSGHMVFAGVKRVERTIRVDGYMIGKAPVAMPPHQRAEMELRDRLNAEVLAQLKEPPTGGRLTGSFIYAHAGGYRGRKNIAYGVPEWRNLFRELKELGMDTAILGVSTWVGSRESFYPSTLFKDFRTWNLIEPMLAAAAEERMIIYLGAAGLGDTERMIGAETGDVRMAAECARQELACYRELTQLYGGAFHGYYLAAETGFWSWGNAEFLTRCFHEYFQRVTNGVKDITPEIAIMGSPYTVRCPGREEEAIATLTAVHEGCPFTALAPQDSIGTTMNELSFLERGLGIWKTVCQNIGTEFWVNCETFNCADYGGPVITIVPADFRRLAIQLDTAQRVGARKLITWEAIHFMNPAGSTAARRLRREYLQHRNPSTALRAGVL